MIDYIMIFFGALLLLLILTPSILLTIFLILPLEFSRLKKNLVKMRVLLGLFLASAMDMSFGIFSAILSSILFKCNLTIMAVIWGVIFSVLPDFDFIFEIIGKRKATGDHKKSFLHYPAVWFVVCGCIYIASPYLCMIAALALLGHIIHDITEEGPGIAIFAPFFKTRYLLQKKEKWSIILSKAEFEYFCSVSMMDWLEREYLSFKPGAFLGLISLIMSLFIL